MAPVACLPAAPRGRPGTCRRVLRIARSLGPIGCEHGGQPAATTGNDNRVTDRRARVVQAVVHSRRRPRPSPTNASQPGSSTSTTACWRQECIHGQQVPTQPGRSKFANSRPKAVLRTTRGNYPNGAANHRLAAAAAVDVDRTLLASSFPHTLGRKQSRAPAHRASSLGLASMTFDELAQRSGL